MRSKSLISLAVAAALAASPAFAAPAGVFLSKGIMGDNTEVAMGQMAQRRSNNPAVRDAGRMLEMDHSQARDQKAALARDMRLPVPNGLKPGAAAESAKLRRLPPRLFDREWVGHMIMDHRKDIAEFERQTRTGDRRTADLARMQLPVLRKHLRTLQAIRL
jgi:putative membrane protein